MLKRSNYPKEILAQISAKKQMRKDEKINEENFDRERLSVLLTEEDRERKFAKAKRALEKEFMSQELKAQIQQKDARRARTRHDELSELEREAGRIAEYQLSIEQQYHNHLLAEQKLAAEQGVNISEVIIDPQHKKSEAERFAAIIERDKLLQKVKEQGKLDFDIALALKQVNG